MRRARRVVAHVFVGDLDRPALADQELHHLSRVLRLRPGEPVSASDGRGGRRLCQWAGTASLEPISDCTWEALPVPSLSVAFALTKGVHPEQAVRQLTEAGVDQVVIMLTERCVARWAPASVPNQLARLREVSRQAAMQSRRAWLPVIEGPTPFSEVLRKTGGLNGPGGPSGSDGSTGPSSAGGPDGAGPPPPCAVALATPGGGPLTLATPTVLIGPEGGWSEAEQAAVTDHVSLGPHVLRAETAALAAGVLLAALRAELVAPSVTAGRE